MYSADLSSTCPNERFHAPRLIHHYFNLIHGRREEFSAEWELYVYGHNAWLRIEVGQG